MKTSEVVRAWGKILKGEQPSLSIEITKECPLRCPGCYAYDDAHLGGDGVTLRSLSDRKGQELIDGVLEVVDRLKPLHLSLVGGDPLVRYREVEALVPLLIARGTHVQIVTSAIHSTITGQMMKRQGYLREFLEFWTPRPEIHKVWFSIFTPQVGDRMPEILTPGERAHVIRDLMELRRVFPKLDMPEGMIRQFSKPPHSPADCVFSLTTQTLSADLRTKVTPCQYGGQPDCGQCGCIASMALAAVAAHKLGGIIPVGAIFKASIKIGQAWPKPAESPRPLELRVLQ